MSETMAAVLIVPFLIALAVTLECARTGCTWLHRRIRRPATEGHFLGRAEISAAQEN